jgi:hypothetical protein
MTIHPHMRPGATVALTSLGAWSERTGNCRISGLYEIVEHEQCDLSAGIRDDSTTLIPAGMPSDAPTDDAWLSVDTDELFAQACPKEEGRRVAQEFWFAAFAE